MSGEGLHPLSPIARECYWRELMRKALPRLRGYAMRTNCSADEVEEIIWDVWQMAVAHEGDLLEHNDSWRILGPLVREACVTRLRAWRRERSIGRLDILDSSEPHEDHEHEQTLADDVTAALADLPEKQRHAVDFRFMWGWPYWAIASALDCSEATARVHVYRGVRRLRSLVPISAPGCQSRTVYCDVEIGKQPTVG